jgi:uncharacterized protein YukE
MPEIDGSLEQGFEHANPTPPDPGEQIENKAAELEGLDHACPVPGARNVGGGGAGGHYALNLEEIQAYAKEVDQVVEEAQERQQNLQRARDDIEAPAPDQHSRFQAGKAKDSIKAAMEHLQGIITYGQSFAKDLRASAEEYRKAEEQGSEDFRNLAP